MRMTRHNVFTEVLAVVAADGNSLDTAAIARAAELLRAGKLVAFPTETVYGLGANALDAGAVARIFEAKGRPANNPVIVHAADIDAARAIVTAWPEAADKLAQAFWPGPLTLVLPKRDRVPDIVAAGGSTVGVRVPANPVALALIREAGVPVAAPSANRSMQVSPTTAIHVLASLSGRIEMILDGGPTTGGIESTVISLAGDSPRLLRPGLITPKQIEAIIGPIDRPGAEPGAANRQSVTPDAALPLPAPGMLARHYAPRAPLEIASDGEPRVRQFLAEGKTVGWLALSAIEPGLAAETRLVRERMPDLPAEYASRLYAALHALDDSGVAVIIVDALPDDDEWLALRDRLNRASAQE